MKGLLLLWALVMLALVGCNNEETYKVEGKSENWSLIINYKLTDDNFYHKATLNYLGNDTPKNFRIIGTYVGVEPHHNKAFEVKDQNQKTFVISEDNVKRHPDLNIDHLKKVVNQSAYFDVLVKQADGQTESEERLNLQFVE